MGSPSLRSTTSSASSCRPSWRLALAGVALLIPLACGGGGGGGGGGSSDCQPFDQLAAAKPKASEPRVAAGSQLMVAIKAQGASATTVAAGLAPSVAPSYQALKVGQTATWGVAVVQVAARPRTLQVDFGDLGPPTTSEVPKGTGACLLRVTLSVPRPARRHPVHFALADADKTASSGASIDAFVDVA